MSPKITSELGEILIHVHYPITGEEDGIVLRVDTDWDADVEPVAVDRAAGRFEFRLTTEEPFVYFKVMLHQGGETLWAVDADRLATSGAERVWDVFPAFRDAAPRFTEIETLETELGSWQFRVFLPADYDDNTLHRYPVLYMQDGHNLFFQQEAAVGSDWGVQDTLRELGEMTSIERVLVVAVYPRDRDADYADHPASTYPRFLAEHLKPHIDEHFRTLPEPEHTAIMGSSLGGVAAFATAWEYPEAFGLVGCLSATFGYRDDLAKRVVSDPKPPIRIYLDSGWPRDNYEVTRDIRARLVTAGFTEGDDLLYFAFPGDRHTERAWGDRCHVPFQFFFGYRPEKRSKAGRHAANAGETGKAVKTVKAAKATAAAANKAKAARRR